MKVPKAIVLRVAGTNCDRETVFALSYSGAKTDLLHINSLFRKEVKLSDYSIIAIPGGFSYGDDIAAGKIFANEFKNKLAKDVGMFVKNGGLIIGICNGFQVLVKTGLLPDSDISASQSVTLTYNDSAKFECRWVYLKKNNVNNIWTKGLSDIIQLPVAHGEGKFVTKDEKVLKDIEKNNQIVFQYCDSKGNLAGYPFNPNGAVMNIAGICDKTGRIFGLMPHPERFMFKFLHPQWTRSASLGENEEGWGLQIFKNAVEYVKKEV